MTNFYTTADTDKEALLALMLKQIKALAENGYAPTVLQYQSTYHFQTTDWARRNLDYNWSDLCDLANLKPRNRWKKRQVAYRDSLDMQPALSVEEIRQVEAEYWGPRGLVVAEAVELPTCTVYRLR